MGDHSAAGGETGEEPGGALGLSQPAEPELQAPRVTAGPPQVEHRLGANHGAAMAPQEPLAGPSGAADSATLTGQPTPERAASPRWRPAHGARSTLVTQPSDRAASLHLRTAGGNRDSSTAQPQEREDAVEWGTLQGWEGDTLAAQPCERAASPQWKAADGKGDSPTTAHTPERAASSQWRLSGGNSVRSSSGARTQEPAHGAPFVHQKAQAAILHPGPGPSTPPPGKRTGGQPTEAHYGTPAAYLRPSPSSQSHLSQGHSSQSHFPQGHSSQGPSSQNHLSQGHHLRGHHSQGPLSPRWGPHEVVDTCCALLLILCDWVLDHWSRLKTPAVDRALGSARQGCLLFADTCLLLARSLATWAFILWGKMRESPLAHRLAPGTRKLVALGQSAVSALSQALGTFSLLLASALRKLSSSPPKGKSPKDAAGAPRLAALRSKLRSLQASEVLALLSFAGVVLLLPGWLLLGRAPQGSLHLNPSHSSRAPGSATSSLATATDPLSLWQPFRFLLPKGGSGAWANTASPSGAQRHAAGTLPPPTCASLQPAVLAQWHWEVSWLRGKKLPYTDPAGTQPQPQSQSQSQFVSHTTGIPGTVSSQPGLGLSDGIPGTLTAQPGLSGRSEVPPLCMNSSDSKPVAMEKLPPWVPAPERYLVGACHFGRTSNRLVCLQRALVMAALLNRTLILVQADVCKSRSQRRTDEMPLLIDAPHLLRCVTPPLDLDQEVWALEAAVARLRQEEGALEAAQQTVLVRQGALEVEQQKLEVAQQRLRLEEQRLEVEQQRLRVQQEKLRRKQQALLRKKHQKQTRLQQKGKERGEGSHLDLGEEWGLPAVSSLESTQALGHGKRERESGTDFLTQRASRWRGLPSLEAASKLTPGRLSTQVSLTRAPSRNPYTQAVRQLTPIVGHNCDPEKDKKCQPGTGGRKKLRVQFHVSPGSFARSRKQASDSDSVTLHGAEARKLSGISASSADAWGRGNREAVGEVGRTGVKTAGSARARGKGLDAEESRSQGAGKRHSFRVQEHRSGAAPSFRSVPPGTGQRAAVAHVSAAAYVSASGNRTKHRTKSVQKHPFAGVMPLVHPVAQGTAHVLVHRAVSSGGPATPRVRPLEETKDLFEAAVEEGGGTPPGNPEVDPSEGHWGVPGDDFLEGSTPAPVGGGTQGGAQDRSVAGGLGAGRGQEAATKEPKAGGPARGVKSKGGGKRQRGRGQEEPHEELQATDTFPAARGGRALSRVASPRKQPLRKELAHASDPLLGLEPAKGEGDDGEMMMARGGVGVSKPGEERTKTRTRGDIARGTPLSRSQGLRSGPEDAESGSTAAAGSRTKTRGGILTGAKTSTQRLRKVPRRGGAGDNPGAREGAAQGAEAHAGAGAETGAGAGAGAETGAETGAGAGAGADGAFTGSGDSDAATADVWEAALDGDGQRGATGSNGAAPEEAGTQAAAGGGAGEGSWPELTDHEEAVAEEASDRGALEEAETDEGQEQKENRVWRKGQLEARQEPLEREEGQQEKKQRLLDGRKGQPKKKQGQLESKREKNLRLKQETSATAAGTTSLRRSTGAGTDTDFDTATGTGTDTGAGASSASAAGRASDTDPDIDMNTDRATSTGVGTGVGRGKGGGARRQLLQAPLEASVRPLVPRIVTLSEYLETHSAAALAVEALFCDKPQQCPRPACRAAGEIEYPEPLEPPFRINRTMPEEDIALLGEYTKDIRVLSLGDVFYGQAEHHRVEGDAPLAPMFGSQCGLLFQPVQEVFQGAEEFAALRGLRAPYAALHLRRTDFQRYCKGGLKCPYWSLEQIAHCTWEDLRGSSIKQLMVATDAPAGEVNELRCMLAERGIEMVHRPVLATAPLASALIEKVLSAKAERFFFQNSSSFSRHISQMRRGLGISTCHDQPICAGRALNFLVPQ